MAAGPVDLMKPFRDAAKAAASQLRAGKSVDITVSGPIILDAAAAEESAFTIGGLILERIKQEMRGEPVPVSEATRERRARYRDAKPNRSPTGGAVKAERYPAGFQPNPDGPYGEDSGYLRTAMVLNIVQGKKDVFAGIPKNRAKAAFVVRRLSPTARGGRELAGAVRESMRQYVKTVVRKTISKALRGTGLRGRLV